MEKYEHKVAGLFGSEGAAAEAYQRLQSEQLDAVKIFRVPTMG